MLTDDTETQPKPVEQLTDKELDREVYSLVFGHPGIWNVPPYTANMVYGWRVVEKMRERGCYWHIEIDGDSYGILVGVSGGGMVVIDDGKQPARAVCEAAVRLLRGDHVSFDVAHDAVRVGPDGLILHGAGSSAIDVGDVVEGVPLASDSSSIVE